jgi:hypothetical protein
VRQTGDIHAVFEMIIDAKAVRGMVDNHIKKKQPSLTFRYS